MKWLRSQSSSTRFISRCLISSDEQTTKETATTAKWEKMNQPGNWINSLKFSRFHTMVSLLRSVALNANKIRCCRGEKRRIIVETEWKTLNKSRVDDAIKILFYSFSIFTPGKTRTANFHFTIKLYEFSLFFFTEHHQVGEVKERKFPQVSTFLSSMKSRYDFSIHMKPCLAARVTLQR